MKKLLRNHPVASLTSLAVIFLGTIIGFYIWGTGYLILVEKEVESQQANNGSVAEFNLGGAAKLDYRGALSVMPTSSNQ
jgi:hypothetical protein